MTSEGFTQPEGELERKIKRAYTEESAPRRARRAKKRLGVPATQTILCAVIFAALAGLRFFSPEGFAAARNAYEQLWQRPEILALEALSGQARDAAAQLVARLDAEN